MQTNNAEKFDFHCSTNSDQQVCNGCIQSAPGSKLLLVSITQFQSKYHLQSLQKAELPLLGRDQLVKHVYRRYSFTALNL